MIIIETSVFTRRVMDLLPDEEYRKLQAALIDRPDLGVVILGSGGLRKVRWHVPGRGKRSGARIIYYWVTEQEKILLLYMYTKSESDDLTPVQIEILRKLVEKEFS